MAFALLLLALAADPTPADLAAARAEFERETARVQQAIDEETAAIRGKYLGKLETLRRAFAAKGNALSALLAKKEIDRVNGEKAGPGAAKQPAFPSGEWQARVNDFTANAQNGLRTFVFDGATATYKGGASTITLKWDKSHLSGTSTDGESMRWTPCADGRWMIEYFKPGSDLPFDVAFAFPSADKRFR